MKVGNKSTKMRSILFLVAFLISTTLFAQTGSYPTTFGDVSLGMSKEAVRSTLKNHPMFSYQGVPDVSMLDNPEENYIVTQGRNYYIKRAVFFFTDEILTQFSIYLDENYITYYDIYSSFRDKYGMPTTIDPIKRIWENDSIQIILEEHMILKYIDKSSLMTKEELAEANPEEDLPLGASALSIRRKNFLEEF